ncbi:MAG: hypothetical protein M2R45_00775 [Verrucomicrobia subdivision 3 bacterium]|nr:hypothetical protein [Limisphaerales bacterium]MCS1413119.1 hypothetical protein [Limisphaerales bacterium]
MLIITPRNEDDEYLANYAYHEAVKSYTFSTRRDDPVFREIMKLLLEHGYGVEGWQGVVFALIVSNIPAIIELEQLCH